MNYYLMLAFILFVYMNFWFIISLIKKRNDVADIAWGLGFVLLAWISFLCAERITLVGLIVALCVTVWGLRLSVHIYQRNKDKGEDYRYKAWRNSWGKWFLIRSYMQVYLLQGFFLYLIFLPVLMIHQDSNIMFGKEVFFGLLVWVCGFLCEAIADQQLAVFMKNPDNKGAIMSSGLWAYSRHPNYFGEVMQWWGIWLIALSTPYGLLAIIGPLTITFLILKVSGIPLLEEKMSQNPDFVAYKKRVSMFIPLPPKR